MIEKSALKLFIGYDFSKVKAINFFSETIFLKAIPRGSALAEASNKI